MIHVVPQSSKTSIVGPHGNTLKIKIAAPPVDGAANAALIHLLKKVFSVSKQDIEILKGHTGKIKLVEIRGLTISEANKCLRQIILKKISSV